MAFRDFTYPDVVGRFELAEGATALFANAVPVPPSPEYQGIARRLARLALHNPSEKAKSEFQIAPLLSELWARFEDRISLYSGRELVADAAAGLTGTCDFVIGRGQQLPRLVSPVVVAVTAERDDLMRGYGPCIASMVGLQRVKQPAPEATVFGIVTTGTLWKIMRLKNSLLYHDSQMYMVNPPDKLLGALVAMIESLLAVPS